MIQDAMQAMIQDGIPMFAKEIEGTYHDTGDKLEYMKTVVDFAMQRQDIGPEFIEFLKSKIN